MVTREKQDDKLSKCSPKESVALTAEETIALGMETYLYVQRRLYWLTSVIGDTTKPFNTYKGLLGRFIWTLNLIIHFSLDFYEAKFLFHASWATSIGIFFLCFVSCTIYTIKYSVPWYIKFVRKLAKNELHVGTMKKLKFIYRVFPFLMPCLAASGAGAQFGCYAYDGALKIHISTNSNGTNVLQGIEILVNVVRMTSLLHIFYAFFFYLVLHLIILYTLQSSMKEFNGKMRNSLKQHPPTIPFHTAVNLFSSRTKLLQTGSKNTTIVLTVILVTTSVSFVINAYNFLFVKRLAIYVWFALAPLVWTVSPLMAGAWVTWTYRNYKYVVIQAWVEIPEEYDEIWDRDDDIKKRQSTAQPSEVYRRILAERDKEQASKSKGDACTVRNRSKSVINVRNNQYHSSAGYDRNGNKQKYCNEQHKFPHLDDNAKVDSVTGKDSGKSAVRNRSKSAVHIRRSELILHEKDGVNKGMQYKVADKARMIEPSSQLYQLKEKTTPELPSLCTSSPKSIIRNRNKSCVSVRSEAFTIQEEHEESTSVQKDVDGKINTKEQHGSRLFGEDRAVTTATTLIPDSNIKTKIESTSNVRDNETLVAEERNGFCAALKSIKNKRSSSQDGYTTLSEEENVGAQISGQENSTTFHGRCESEENHKKELAIITVSEAMPSKSSNLNTFSLDEHVPEVTVNGLPNSNTVPHNHSEQIVRKPSEDSVFNLDSSIDSNYLRPVKRKYGQGSFSLDFDTLSVDTVETHINDSNLGGANRSRSIESLNKEVDVKAKDFEGLRPLSARVTRKEYRGVEDKSGRGFSDNNKKASTISEPPSYREESNPVSARSLSTVSFVLPESETLQEERKTSKTLEFSTVVGVRQQLETLKKKVIKRRKFNYEKYIKYLDCILVTVGFSIGGVIVTWDRASFFCVVLFTLVGVFAQEAFLK